MIFSRCEDGRCVRQGESLLRVPDVTRRWIEYLRFCALHYAAMMKVFGCLALV